MKIRLVIPSVNTYPTERPHGCVYCGHWRLHRHGTVRKSLKDHRRAEVAVERYRCVGCGRTFRHDPDGVTGRDQSQRTIVLAALLYGLGLSCHAAAHFLDALGIDVCAMMVWRDAQEAGKVLRRTRPADVALDNGAHHPPLPGVDQVDDQMANPGRAIDVILSRGDSELGYLRIGSERFQRTAIFDLQCIAAADHRTLPVEACLDD